MFNPVAKALEEKQVAPLFTSIGSQLVEKVIESSDDRSKRTQDGRMIMIHHLKAFEERGNRL